MLKVRKAVAPYASPNCDLAALWQPAAHGAANREGNNAKMGNLCDSRNNRQERFYG